MLQPQLRGSNRVPDLSPAVYDRVAKSYGPALKAFADTFHQFADRTFDVIVSSLMLHHAGGGADRNQVLHEMVRVLKPGGTVLLYDVSPLIGAAAQQLRARGLGSLSRSGGVMALLSARRLTSAGAS